MTAQNTQKLKRVELVSADFVAEQLDVLLEDIRPNAAKTGALGSARTVEVDLSAGGRLRVVSISIGDEWAGPWMASVVLELSSGRQVIRSASEPFVWIASAEQDQIVLESARFSSELHYDILAGRPLVVCEVLPWTS